ncbi:plasmid encoded RepA protein [filamentous cyanobacterium CCP1]|nr:plasmid encoded RepA protein [filamentous cyanobacterium CCP1]
MAKKLSPVMNRYIESVANIQQMPQAYEPVFTPRELVQATLPHSNPGDDMPTWSRRNGNYVLGIQPGWNYDKDESFGYPYGTIPRLLIYWIATEVLRKKQRRLELGDTLNGFMDKVGLNPETGGGKRSDAKRLREQMDRLFHARITFQYSAEMQQVRYRNRLDMQVAPKTQVWWSEQQPDQQVMFGSWIELGEEFYQAIMECSVPIDMRALRALKKSPLALDLYAWATFRAVAATRKGRMQKVPWKALAQQFGSDYARPRDFKTKARAQLKKIQLVYPDLNLEEQDDYLIIRPSLPAIPEKVK